jgi:hypothetical protein
MIAGSEIFYFYKLNIHNLNFGIKTSSLFFKNYFFFKIGEEISSKNFIYLNIYINKNIWFELVPFSVEKFF